MADDRLAHPRWCSIGGPAPGRSIKGLSQRDERGYDQTSVSAGDSAGGIGDDDGIIAGLGELDVGKSDIWRSSAYSIGVIGYRGAIELPLVGQGKSAGGGDAESDAASEFDGLREGLGDDGRRDGSQLHLVDPGAVLTVSQAAIFGVSPLQDLAAGAKVKREELPIDFSRDAGLFEAVDGKAEDVVIGFGGDFPPEAQGDGADHRGLHGVGGIVGKSAAAGGVHGVVSDGILADPA